MPAGTTYKQCGCRDENGKRLGQKCTRLRRPNGTWNPGHGRWYYQLELPPHPAAGRRSPLGRGGFASQGAAQHELGQARELLTIAPADDPEARARIGDALLAAIRDTGQLPHPRFVRRAVGGGHDPAVRPPTVGEWLEGQWLPAKKKLRAGTVRSYEAHIRLYFLPHIGRIRIDRLQATDVAAVFEAIDELNDLVEEARADGDPAVRTQVKGRRLVGPATRQRIRATLRSALGTYMRQHPGLLAVNVAALIELPSGKRPRPLVWTDERVRAWQRDVDARLAAAREKAGGGRVSPLDIWVSTPRPSPVRVWTPAQTSVFLGRARRHRLYALYHLVALRGLRRGEACGLRRPDTDLDTATTTVRWQITQLGWEARQGAPKSEAGERHVALDAQTVEVIRAHRAREDTGRPTTGPEFEFANPDGTPLHPAAVTGLFELLAYLAGLPPIRLHDLRHGAATLLLAAGHHMKVVQETLGLSSITIAADPCTSVLPELARRSAEDVAALIRADEPGTPPAGAARPRRGTGRAPGNAGAGGRAGTTRTRGKVPPKSRETA
jgi:integrase